MRANDRRQQRCRVIREMFGKTVEDVAKEAGVSEKTVYRFETKKFKRDTDEILKCYAWYNEHMMMLYNDGFNVIEMMSAGVE